MFICRWPGSQEPPALEAVTDDEPMHANAEKPGLVRGPVLALRQHDEPPAASVRDLAFTYGLSQLDIGVGGGDAHAGPEHAAPYRPAREFTVTAYV